MRILHVLGDSAFGGGSRIVLKLCLAARDAGHAPAILTTDATFIRHAEDLGIPVVALPCIVRPIAPWRDWRGERRLFSFLCDHRYDLVHTHTSKAGILGRRAAWRAKVPIVIHTVHGFAFHEQTSWPLLQVYAACERAAARWCHRLVTVSEFHRDWAQRLGISRPPHLLAIPNGIAPAPELPSARREALRAEFGAGPEHILVVSAGRLAPGKGLEDLLRAVARLPATEQRRLRVVLPGTGPLAPELPGLAARLGVAVACRFPGFRDDVREILAASDLAALPTYREGMSVALLEAMAAGLPVVTTTIGSNQEVTRGGSVAVLHRPGDIAALADALVALVSSPQQRDRIGRAAREVFTDHYTEQTMLGRYLKLYDDLATARLRP